MALYRIAPVVLAVPLFFYSYFYIQRIFALLRRKKLLPAQKAVCALAALVITVPSMNVWGVWAMVVLHGAVIAGAVDLVRLLTEKICRKRNLFWYRFCCSGLIPVLGTVLILGGAWLNMHRIVETEYTVITGKELEQGGYNAVFLSDLHFGTTMDKDRLAEICDRIEACDPDVVILGGDLVDERSTKEEVQEAFEVLSGIDSTCGIYYIYGNHDKGRYSSDCDFTEDELEEAITGSGITILEDETCVLNCDLTLTGRKDRTDASRDGQKRKSAKKLLNETAGGAYHILADHQPRYFEKYAEAGYDLMLSGHTHGGQMWPIGLLTKLFDRETINYGHEERDGMDVIVSSGIGGWGYPFRTGKHSEFVVVHIREETPV